MTPTFYYIISIGFLLATLAYGLIAYLVWQKERKTSLDRVFLSCMGVVTGYYAANLLAAIQQYVVDDPRTPSELVLYVVAYLCVCLLGPLIRHLGFLLFLPGEEVTRRRLVMNYLPIFPFVVGLLVIPPPLLRSLAFYCRSPRGPWGLPCSSRH